MSRTKVVGVVGSKGQEDVTNAKKLGQLIAKEGWVIVSGGRNVGVQRAVNEGAAGALTVGILPGHDPSDVASGVRVAIFTDLNNARNNVVVLSSDVVVACGVPRPGTASEVALALKNKKPVVLLGASPVAVDFFRSLSPELVHPVESPEKAIEKIKEI
jgi:uncharacterized protein (TIGR00725 family)